MTALEQGATDYANAADRDLRRMIGDSRYEQYKQRFMADLTPIIYNSLADSRVGDVYVNGGGHLLFRVHGKGGFQLQRFVVEPEHSERICRTALAINGMESRAEMQRLFDCQVPFFGARMSITAPPVSRMWTFTIRKLSTLRRSMEEHVAAGVLLAEEVSALREAYRNDESIVVGGATGSGKTVLLQSIIDDLVAYVRPQMEKRIIFLEHVSELQSDFPAAEFWRMDFGTSMLELVHHALRNDPDWIIGGELRDGAALPFLRGATTGHPWMATTHSNSAAHTLVRLCDLAQETAPGLNPAPLVAEAVKIVLYVQRRSDGTRHCPGPVRVLDHHFNPATRTSHFKTAPLVSKTPVYAVA
jgi:type IV secretion system protein VirB11